MLLPHGGKIAVVTRTCGTNTGIQPVHLPEHRFNGSRGADVHPQIPAVPARDSNVVPDAKGRGNFFPDGTLTTNDQYLHEMNFLRSYDQSQVSA
jgi:hypothetical protein